MSDKDRLDFLENNKQYMVGHAPSGDFSVFNLQGNMVYGKTVREAIDAAIHMDEFISELVEIDLDDSSWITDTPDVIELQGSLLIYEATEDTTITLKNGFSIKLKKGEKYDGVKGIYLNDDLSPKE